MLKPLVSVIMPCHNAEAYVREAVKSVCCQSVTEWELVAVDDGSTDGTLKILREQEKEDGRIRVIALKQASGSPATPRNKGIEAARGRYIAFLDSDDQWMPFKLQDQLMLMKQGEAFVYSNYEKVDSLGTRQGRIVTAPQRADYRQLLRGNYIACSTVLYDTEVIGKRYFKCIGHEDFCCWLDILRDGFQACNTNTVEMLYRVTNGSVSHNKLKTIAWTWHIVRKEQKLRWLPAVYYLMSHLIKASLKKRI